MDIAGHTALLLVLHALCHPGATLRILETGIPTYKLRGETAELSCKFDLEGDPLYSVKWYKDDEEFFRYMPSSDPPPSIFPRPGVTVKLSSSSESRVVLTDLDFRSSGLYRCEISIEDSFNTLNRYGRMMVVELPTTAPKISGVAEKYVSGDLLQANCTAGRSHPAATITWHINGKEVPHKHTFTYLPQQHHDGLETSMTELRLRLRDHHFSSGVILLRCTATVAALYTRSDQDFLQLEDKQLTPIVLEQRDSQISVNGCPSCLPSPLLLLLLLLAAMRL